MNASVLEQYGMDYHEGIIRCLNDEGIYRRILSLFLEDESYNRTKAACERHDYGSLFECVHELKGASGNAALTELFSASCALVEYLRAGGRDDADVDALFAPIASSYMRAKEGIALALKE